MPQTRFLHLPPLTFHTPALLTGRLIATFPKLALRAPTPLSISHALYRSPHTQPPQPDSETQSSAPKQFAHLHVLELSTHPGGAYICTFPPPPPPPPATIETAAPASQDPAHDEAPPPPPPQPQTTTVKLASSASTASFTRLLQTKLSAIWSPAPSSESLYGYIHAIGITEVGILEVRGESGNGAVIVFVRVGEEAEGLVDEVFEEMREKLELGGSGVLVGGEEADGEVERWCRVLGRRGGRRGGA
ncbi:MAG: hypothetical protein M1828_007434 [Chrysothrix sp. TS-e1954]|nr:MAG: hypothetical protein M1828_007434 [Chrysothrix sp. TS-e1954]